MKTTELLEQELEAASKTKHGLLQNIRDLETRVRTLDDDLKASKALASTTSKHLQTAEVTLAKVSDQKAAAERRVTELTREQKQTVDMQDYLNSVNLTALSLVQAQHDALVRANNLIEAIRKKKVRLNADDHRDIDAAMAVITPLAGIVKDGPAAYVYAVAELKKRADTNPALREAINDILEQYPHKEPT